MAQHSREQPHVVIIGAGIGGMTMAIELKRMGFSKFTIIEKASEVGGTWRDNIYPGCSSDVSINLYSLSTDLNPNWTHSHAFQPEIQEYWIQLVLKYDLYPKMIFNRRVVSAQWDMKAQKYDILTEDRDGTQTSLTAAILVSAIGLLEIPSFPDIPGISRFRGDSFHSARWGQHYFPGRKTSRGHWQWFFSIQAYRYHNIVAHGVGSFLLIFRNFQYLRRELMYLAIFGSSFTKPYFERQAKAYMAEATPVEYLNQVIPSGPSLKLGCKRIVFDTNYLTSLARPNMSLVWDPIESINEEGIVTGTGSTAFDVIIYSTGYITDGYSLNLKGSSDQTVAEYYEAHGGPTAYLGTTLPGFPNFFTISGANTATGYTSLLFAEEVQVKYIIQMITPVIAGDISSMEVTAEATDAYNRDIQARLAGSIWSTCFSWYRTGNTGKIHGLFPGPMTLFWLWLRRPNWAHYKVLTVGQWKPKRTFYGKLSVGLFFLVLGLGVAAASSDGVVIFKPRNVFRIGA